MVDKFTKWIEAKPVKTAEFGPVIDFISEVIHRYCVPHCRGYTPQYGPAGVVNRSGLGKPADGKPADS